MKTLLSGMRPTGQLHIGHYFGVIQNWVRLASDPKINCFFMVADWHSLTTKYDSAGSIGADSLEVVKDYLACGVDPERATIFLQSAVPAIAELHIILSMITPNSWPEGDPTLKDLVRARSDGALSYGMLGYPVLQSADILAFQAELVPVGKDQEAHLEMSRDLARRFNHLYKSPHFPEPKALFTETPSLAGLDGGKMSKSFDNDIKIASDAQETIKRVLQMITDPERQRRNDPGDVSRCVVPYPYYQLLASAEITAQVKEECESAKRGCFDCKKQLAEILNAKLASFRSKRAELSDQKVLDILRAGNAQANQVAGENLRKVKALIGLCSV